MRLKRLIFTESDRIQQEGQRQQALRFLAKRKERLKKTGTIAI